MVALHPEGVDRNMAMSSENKKGAESPSTRRAWIEIDLSQKSEDRAFVALHPEGVDRNYGKKGVGFIKDPSPSTRRAWIEIKARYTTEPPLARRPPPGGRG